MTRKSKNHTPAIWQLCLVRAEPKHALDPVPRLLLSAQAREVIEHEAQASPDVETGGILVGHFEPPLTLRVTSASGPGPLAQRTPTHFLRDTDFCAAFLRECYEHDGADYLGDWHSHLRQVASENLSVGDIVTLMQAIHDPDYADMPGFGKILALCGAPPAHGRRQAGISQKISQKVELNGFVALAEFVVEVAIEPIE